MFVLDSLNIFNGLLKSIIELLGIRTIVAGLSFVALFLAGRLIYRIKSTVEVLSIWEDIPAKFPKYLEILKYFRKFIKPSFYDRTYSKLTEKSWSFDDLNKNIHKGKNSPVIIIYAPAGMGKTRTCQQLLLLHRWRLKKSARYYKNDNEITLKSTCKLLREIKTKKELIGIIDSFTKPFDTTLLLDGFDELPFLDGDENNTTGVLRDWLQHLSYKGAKFRKIIITMRLEPFSKALDYFTKLTLAEFKPTVLELKPLKDTQAVNLFRYNTNIKKRKDRKKIEQIIKSNFNTTENEEGLVNLFCIPFFARYADVIILKNNVLPIDKAIDKIAKTDINNISQADVQHITQSGAIDSIAYGTIAQETKRYSEIVQTVDFEKKEEEQEKQIKLSRMFLSRVAMKIFKKSNEVNASLSLTQDEYDILSSECGIGYHFSTRSLLQRFNADSIAFLHGYFYEYFLIQASDKLSRSDKLSIFNGYNVNLNKKRMIDHYLHWLDASGNSFDLYNCIRFINNIKVIFKSVELKIVYKSKYTLSEFFLLLPNLNELFFSVVDEQGALYSCCYNYINQEMYSMQHDNLLKEINSKIIRVRTPADLSVFKINNIELSNVYIFFELKYISYCIDIYHELNNNEIYKSCHLIINPITEEQIYEIDFFMQKKHKIEKMISDYKNAARINYLSFFSKFLENAWGIFNETKKYDINRPEMIYLQHILAAKKNELGLELLSKKIRAYNIINKEYVYLHDSSHSKKKYLLFDAVLDNLKYAVNLDSKNYVYYYNLAILHFQFDKIHEAISYFTASINIRSDFQECFFYRGKSYFIQENYENALIDFDKAIGLDKDKSYFYAARGDLFLASSRIFDAIEDYNNSIEIYGIAECYCKRGLAYIISNNLSAAKNDFKKTISISATRTNYYYIAISLLNAMKIIEEVNNLHLKIDLFAKNGYIIPIIMIVSKSHKSENKLFSQIPDSSLRKNIHITNFPSLNDIKVLDASSFRDCIQIKNVTLPNSIIKIGDFVFSGCEQLCEIHLNQGIIELGNRFIAYTKVKEIIIPSTVKKMEYALDRASCIKKIIFENGIKTIPDKAISPFYPDEKMPVENIILPNTVKIIGRDAFLNCVLLQDIIIPDGVITISEFSFDGCVGLTEITIPNTVEEIKEGAFVNCERLTQITFGSSLKTLGFKVFANTAIKKIHLPVTIQEINGAFDEATELHTVIFKEGTQSIPKKAFNSMNPLSGHLRVVIPSTVNNIPSCAFENSMNIAICCNEGSFAHKYAEEHKIDYILEN